MAKQLFPTAASNPPSQKPVARRISSTEVFPEEEAALGRLCRAPLALPGRSIDVALHATAMPVFLDRLMGMVTASQVTCCVRKYFHSPVVSGAATICVGICSLEESRQRCVIILNRGGGDMGCCDGGSGGLSLAPRYRKCSVSYRNKPRAAPWGSDPAPCCAMPRRGEAGEVCVFDLSLPGMVN